MPVTPNTEKDWLCLDRDFETPPGGFRYKQVETGVVIYSIQYSDWLAKIKLHRLANNLPMGLNWQRECVDQLCRTLPPGHCFWCGDRSPYGGSKANYRITKERFERGTATLVDAIVFDETRVDQKEAERRGDICRQCIYNQPVPYCHVCGGQKILNWISRIVEKRKTTHDAGLHACWICGCALKAKVWLPLETIRRHEQKDLQETYPDHCWLKA